jgi:hypothetical protein
MHPNVPAPPLIQYVSDRDLWAFKLPHSREVAAALRLYPFRFEIWEKILHDVLLLKDEGRTCLQQEAQAVESYLTGVQMKEIAG